MTDMRINSSPNSAQRSCCTCTEGRGVCNGESVLITTSQAREVFLRCAPVSISGSSREQAVKFYECLPRKLQEAGVTLKDVVWERIFFRNVKADYDVFTDVRREAYWRAGVNTDKLPAATYIEQPPCRHEQAFELQLYAIAPADTGRVRVHSFPRSEWGATTKLIEIGDYRHLYITNINGRGNPAFPAPPFREQSDSMFATARQMLQSYGTTFPKVLRTWCYLDDIDRDYDEFNLSRNEFFKEHDVRRLPASTGIRAGLYPPGTECSMDLYALLNPDGASIEVMHTPTLNEAEEYGSAFSRGMKVSTPDKTVLFISGTASVDEQGATVHLGDERKQIERMLLNIKELLRPHGATFADLTQIITYLKWRRELDTFVQVWDEWGLSGLPNTFVEAGVCRPNLLCEMEAIAVIPARR